MEFILFLVLLGIVIGFPTAMEFRKKRLFEQEFLNVQNFSNAIINDFNLFSKDQRTQCILFLYHRFEDIWKQWPATDEPSELFEKFLYHSSSEKLTDVYLLVSRIWKHQMNPQPSTTADGLLACSCMSEVLRRKYARTAISNYVIHRTKGIFNCPIEKCPTLQTAMWRQRFESLFEKHHLYPFIQDTKSPTEL